MAYTPTTWTNESPAATPVRYTLRDGADVIINDDVRIDLKTAVTAGTPLNSTNLNHIEQGIKDAHDIIAPKTRKMLIPPFTASSDPDMVGPIQSFLGGHFAVPADYQADGKIRAILYSIGAAAGTTNTMLEKYYYAAVGERFLYTHSQLPAAYTFTHAGLSLSYKLQEGPQTTLTGLAAGDFVRCQIQVTAGAAVPFLLGWVFEYTASL